MSAEVSPVAVLFDFDGTLGDTEVPAMEIAFWMLAPYIIHLEGKSDAEVEAQCPIYVRENAGKAFEHMIKECDEVRIASGRSPVEVARTARQETPELLSVIDRKRAELGLQTIAVLREKDEEPPTLLQQQKEDTVTRLAKVAQPVSGVVDTLTELNKIGVPFVIATTSGKPRVPVCVDTAGLRSFFPSDDLHIHSGESDFDPPKFKPAPDVYVRAASFVERKACDCVAVEDSGSGVGSASNANIGLLVGYVGASHISAENRASHAQMLMAGTRAENGRGADIVIHDMRDLSKLVQKFEALISSGRGGDGTGRSPLALSRADLSDLDGNFFTRE